MTNLPTSVLHCGMAKAATRPIALRAGPLTMLFEPETAFLRHIRLGDNEVCRAIYAAVRDQNWATVLPELSNLAPHVQKDSFRITFDVRCRKEDIDYAWRGEVTGDKDGRVAYTFDGEAKSSFLRNRVGICVLHPITECAGKAVVIEHVDGTTENGVFPREIAPHQPFKEIRAISYEAHGGIRAEFRFEGEIFEMEDQRNWSDASFKTYCTPLRIPIPAQVKAGDKVHHRCTLALTGAVKTVLPIVQGRPPQISIVTTRALPLPPIGFCIARDAEPLTAREVERLKSLQPAHLRVDLRLADATYPETLERAAREAKQVGTRLHIAATVDDDGQRQLNELRGHIDRIKPSVGLWLVFHEKEESTKDRWLLAAREALQSYSPETRFCGGTLDWFTEINRNRPMEQSPWFTCYSLTPQVHAFDNTTLVENLEAQAFTVASAHLLTAKPLVISPITLRMRDKWGSHKRGFPPDADPRQMSLFAAGWTLGSMARLAASGHIHSLVYYETKGPRGLMESEHGSKNSEHFPSIPGAVFPMYHVFADIAEFRPQGIYPAVSTHPLQAEALTMFDDKKRRRILVANLTAETQQIKIKSGATPATVRLLDQTNAEQAMNDPDAFRKLPPATVQPVAAKIELDLLPYAVARVDLAS